MRHWWVLIKLALVVVATVVLLAATVLATVKPRGLTRYGYRRTTGAAPHR